MRERTMHDDLTGRRFGDYIVEKFDENSPKNRYNWVCKCRRCGAERIISRNWLLKRQKDGIPLMCKCNPSYRSRRPCPRVDITGQRFGKLTAEYRLDKTASDGSYLWHCKCDCGNECDVSLNNLNTGHTRSCGCLAKEAQYSRVHKINQYEDENNYMIGFTTNTGLKFKFDKEDYEKIRPVCWVENDQGYIVGNKDGTVIRQHRLLLGLENTGKPIIDHINGDRADNRKMNLRIANKSNNGINRTCNYNNKLGVKGVCLENDGKYCARIEVNYKHITIGRFDTLEEAKKAREEAEERYFGNFAYLESQRIAEINDQNVEAAQ